jgi:hypothetical protein
MAEVDAGGAEAEEEERPFGTAASMILDPPGIVDVSVGASLSS